MIVAGLGALMLCLLLAANGTLVACTTQIEECFDDSRSFLQTDLQLRQRQLEHQRQQSEPERPSNRPSKPSNYWRQTLHNSHDLEYTADIMLGGQRLAAVMDTGSFEILAFSISCVSCGKAAKYNRGSSSTFAAGSLVKTQTFGSGTTMSADAVDTFTMGPLTVKHQDFWMVRQAIMPVLANSSFQAIVGLGPPGEPQQEVTIKPPKNKGITEIILSKNDSLLENLGTRYLSACLQWESYAPGYLIWNDVPPLRQPVPFTQIDVITNITWSVVLTASRFEGPEGTIELGCRDGCEAVMDTGTSLIAVPKPIYDLALQQLSRLDADCSNLRMMPDLVFQLGGHTYSLPPQSYIGLVNGTLDNHTKDWMPEDTGTTTCSLLLMDAGGTAGMFGSRWIIGMPFFRYYYTTFDLGPEPLNASGRKIWTAPASASCSPVSESGHSSHMTNARSRAPWRINGTMIRTPMRHSKYLESLSENDTIIDLLETVNSSTKEE